jgi:CRISP-associated protein Cas1
MATFIVDRSNITLKSDGGVIALYEEKERRGTIPMQLLDRLILQGNIQLDTKLLTTLTGMGVAILMLSPRHSHKIATLIGPRHNDVAIRLGQARQLEDHDFCQRWSRLIVLHKIRAQRQMLSRALVDRPDQRKSLTDAIDRLSQAIEQIRSQQPDPASLRGIEGAAARSHFAALATILPPALKFGGRNRRPPRDPVNACLSLGYTLLHFEAVRVAHRAGLDPHIGYYHRPSFRRESLASDLIEPLRPHIDYFVWDEMRERILREDHFETQPNGGACLLNKAGRAIFYSHIQELIPTLSRRLRRHCAQLVNSLKQSGESYFDHQEDDEA